MKVEFVRASCILLFAAVVAGCTTPKSAVKPEPGSVPAALAKAEALYTQGKYADAMMQCIDVSRRDPQAPGLTDLQEKIINRLSELRADTANRKAADTAKRMEIDITERRALPDAYGLQRAVKGESSSLRTAPTAMEKVLQKRVSVHLDGVSLDDFILAIGASEDVNIIADNIDNTKTMTVRAEEVPLAELLDYISRNMGVSFFVGDSIIWATQRDQAQPTIPMETRMYHLRKGLSGTEVGDAAKINIVEAVERFVPKIPGSDLLFNSKGHVLIAKNTRENLVKIEDIVEALDVCPPQILIEARFISTSFNDLRELGIDWILNSPVAVTRKNVLRNGVTVAATHTQINPSTPDNIIGFTDFPNAKQGLNLTYQGVLTDPMFQAVLHALETSGKSRTLSVPKVTAVNNHAATMRIGEDLRERRANLYVDAGTGGNAPTGGTRHPA